jgi:zinc transporter ZupT
MMIEFLTDANYQNALVLSLISGLATTVGGVVVIAFGAPSNKMTGLMLGFASGFVYI